MEVIRTSTITPTNTIKNIINIVLLWYLKEKFKIGLKQNDKLPKGWDLKDHKKNTYSLMYWKKMYY